jgi:HAE1 family hydrophobic/amphiphilic exporter-1
VALTYLDGLARRLRPFLPRSADDAHRKEAPHPAE